VQVSTHYLISDTPTYNEEIPVYKLVDPERRAWHVANSSWQRNSSINFSIGIQLVNLGFVEKEALAEQLTLKFKTGQYPRASYAHSHYQYSQAKQRFCFPEKQIAALIDLTASLVRQYHIKPTRIVAHADVASGHKQDPGPLLPWYTLADNKLGVWPRAAVVEYYEKSLKEQSLTLAQQQAALKQYGYEIPTNGILDQETKNTIAAFQMHFSPTDYLGEIDSDTLPVLCALLEDYFPEARDSILGAQIPSSWVTGPAINSQQFLKTPPPPVALDDDEVARNIQFAIFGISGAKTNRRLTKSMASLPEDTAVQLGSVTSNNQLFKPAGLSQLLNRN
jgi:N-acetyl-anhydromuramyl-L-alanine amidase AmpD